MDVLVEGPDRGLMSCALRTRDIAAQRRSTLLVSAVSMEAKRRRGDLVDIQGRGCDYDPAGKATHTDWYGRRPPISAARLSVRSSAG